MEAQILFLTSALDGGQWLASRPSCFIVGATVHGNHSLGGQMGLSVGPDALKKIYCIWLELNHELSVVQYEA